MKYKDGLEKPVLERYMAKPSLIGGIDSYETDKGKLTSNVQCLPEITYIDILNYLVRHSQRINDTPLKPWIIAQKAGIVEAAHCDCMAGLGKACSHIGALLFYIETAVRIENAKTVTQEKAYWLLPSSIDKVGYAEVSNIDFTSAENKKKKNTWIMPSVEPPIIRKKTHRI
ncbi:hypothetical protein ACJMK2_022979 [Sinanodonta woodiana]|uniref:SWIM-type domain-containing protein n=1 Tax=Sinanodonta woodiana TaxID=1069815 RepID=A0ABD3TNI4_SINWO